MHTNIQYSKLNKLGAKQAIGLIEGIEEIGLCYLTNLASVGSTANRIFYHALVDFSEFFAQCGDEKGQVIFRYRYRKGVISLCYAHECFVL